MKKALSIVSLLILGAALHYAFQVVFQPAPVQAQFPDTLNLPPDADKHNVRLQRLDISSGRATINAKVFNGKIVGFSCVDKTCWIVTE